MCGASVVGQGKISNSQASAAANLEKPILTPLWAAGLSFSRCHAERNVPNDIELKGIFSGEEYGRGSRLWTHGYDFYTITRPIIATYYGAEKGGHGTWRTSRDEDKIATQRLKTLLKWPQSDQSPEAYKQLGRYTMGTRRTLEQYIPVSGVDTKNGRVLPGKHCLVKYVPWMKQAQASAYSEYADGGADAGTSAGADAGAGGARALLSPFGSLRKKGMHKKIGRHKRAVRFRRPA